MEHDLPTIGDIYVDDFQLVEESFDVQSTAGLNIKQFTGEVNVLRGRFGGSANYWTVAENDLYASYETAGNLYLRAGKANFSDATDGFILGINAGVPTFYMGGATDSILMASGSITITGTITATSGVIGGFTIAATTLTATNLVLDSANQKITLGSSNNIIILDAADATNRLGIGNATLGSCPFRVSKAGAVTTTAITISGLQAGSDVDGQYLTAATVANAKRTVSYEVNLCLNKYADFEQYVNGDTIGTADNCTCTADTTNFIFGTKSLKIVTTAAYGTCYFGATTTTYNIPVEPSTKYIVSFWAKGNAGGESVRTGLRVNNGDAFRDYDNTTITNAWVRYSRTITLEAGDTSAELTFGSPDDATTFWIDGVMLEKASAATSPEPSAWRPGATTEIYGDNLIPLSIAQLSTIAQLINNTDVSLVEKRSNRFDNQMIFLGRDNDGLTESVPIGPGGRTITRYALYTYLESNDATTCEMYNNNLGTSPLIDYDKDMEFTISIKTEIAVTQDILIGFAQLPGVAVPADATYTTRHIGFFIQDAVIYASNANNTTQTRTDVTGAITMTNWNSYRLVYTAGVDVKFYINDVLVATHTTNLPSGGTVPHLFIGTEQQSGAGSLGMYVKNNYQVIVNVI